jgi:mannosyl-3-phosphoglycerate phosphatase
VTEPITWLDTMTRLEQFKMLLAEHGLQLQKGGRFYHVMAHHDKASALEWVVNQSVSAGRFGEQNSNLAEKVFAKSPWVFALGDGGNDKQMIQTADVGLVLPAANGDSLKIDRKNVFTAEKSSPYGWVEALQEYLINPLEQV